MPSSYYALAPVPRRGHRPSGRHPLGHGARSTGGCRRRPERRRLHRGLRRERVPAHRLRGEGVRARGVVGPKEARRLERNVVLVAAARGGLERRGVEGVDPARAASSSAPRSVASWAFSRSTRCCRSAARACVAVVHPQRARRLGGHRDRPRAPRAELRAGLRLRYRLPCRGRGGRADQARGCGRRARGRDRGLHAPGDPRGVRAMRGLVAEEEDPTLASRLTPRAGVVMGEGSCVLLLEDLERAQARGHASTPRGAGYGTVERRPPHGAARPESVGVEEMMRAPSCGRGWPPSGWGT